MADEGFIPRTVCPRTIYTKNDRYQEQFITRMVDTKGGLDEEQFIPSTFYTKSG